MSRAGLGFRGPRDVIETFTTILDWFGVIVFAITGALVASRKQMDIVGFAMLACVTAIGGGTVRDVVLGLTPVFWVKQPAYLLVGIGVAVAAFCTAHIPASRYQMLRWFDAIGLALFAVTGADRALSAGTGPSVAVALGVATATFGGMIRDVLGGESPIVLCREIYITAALAGASVFVGLKLAGIEHDVAMIAGFLTGLGLRAAALHRGWTLPRYKPRPPRDGPPASPD